tara:strand:- start:158 stop:409 length:252 start_codon:yes stop_codon:yes gene_type:complete
MITGQSYGAPTGTAGLPAIKIKDIDAEWVLIIMVTEPTMPFSGMSRETNIIPGDLQVFEAKVQAQAPTEAEMMELRHIVYVAS